MASPAVGVGGIRWHDSVESFGKVGVACDTIKCGESSLKIFSAISGYFNFTESAEKLLLAGNIFKSARDTIALSKLYPSCRNLYVSIKDLYVSIKGDDEKK